MVIGPYANGCDRIISSTLSCPGKVNLIHALLPQPCSRGFHLGGNEANQLAIRSLSIRDKPDWLNLRSRACRAVTLATPLSRRCISLRRG